MQSEPDNDRNATTKDGGQRAWEEFAAFLREQGARVTASRKIVLEQAQRRGDHFTADELAADLAKGQMRVSRGTVYRTLALMAQAGMLRTIRDSDVHTHYEWAFEQVHHDHLICQSCGKFEEFQDAMINERIDAVCRQFGFGPRQQSLVVLGTCRACRSRGK